MKKYFIHEGEKQEGPFTIDELKLKSLSSNTPVWHEGLKDWTTVSEIDELNALVTSPPPMKMASSAPSTGTSARLPNQTVIVNNQEKKSNGAGTAGFVLSLVALFSGWIPIAGWIVWLLGLIFSLVGLSKQPRGLAIAGAIISLIGIIILLVLSAGIAAYLH